MAKMVTRTILSTEVKAVTANLSENVLEEVTYNIPGKITNKDKAMKVLHARLYAAEKTTPAAAIAGEGKSQVGTGDRSERIRTYNYPQGRVTDHRINLTLYRLEQILNGDLDELIDALITADTAAKLSAAEE